MTTQIPVPEDVRKAIFADAMRMWVLKERLKASWPVVERVLGTRMPRARSQMQLYWTLLRMEVDEVVRSSATDSEIEQVVAEHVVLVRRHKRRPGRKRSGDVSDIGVSNRNSVDRHVAALRHRQPSTNVADTRRTTPETLAPQSAVVAEQEKASHIVAPVRRRVVIPPPQSSIRNPKERPAEKKSQDEEDDYWGADNRGDQDYV